MQYNNNIMKKYIYIKNIMYDDYRIITTKYKIIAKIITIYNNKE